MRLSHLISFVFVSVILIACSQAGDYAPEPMEANASYEDASTEYDVSGNGDRNKGDYRQELEEVSEKLPDENGYISSSAAQVNKDTTKEFIRTANLRFRVIDVRSSTQALENITDRYKGYVTYTNLISDINRTEITAVSADSSLESIFYTVKNNLEIRVPNAELYDVLKLMSKEIDYLDYRTIRAQEVTFSLLENEMEKKRISEHSKRLAKAIDKKGHKLEETTDAETSLLYSQEQKDNAILSSLQIQDKIDYSTINLQIYQREVVKRSLIENQKNIDEYQPGFFSQLGEAAVTGWDILKMIILGLFRIWPFLLILIGGIVGYRLFLMKK